MSNTQETEDLTLTWIDLFFLLLLLLLTPLVCYLTYLLIDNYERCVGRCVERLLDNYYNTADFKKQSDAADAKHAAAMKKIYDDNRLMTKLIQEQRLREYIEYKSQLPPNAKLKADLAKAEAELAKIKAELAALKPNVSNRSATSAKDKKGQ